MDIASPRRSTRWRCFFLTMPPPPRSTLFPYTTLFRSRVPDRELRPEGSTPAGTRHPLGASRDRKSTRLNSSHRCISYAVFCLKKKNDAGDVGVEARHVLYQPDFHHPVVDFFFRLRGEC